MYFTTLSINDFCIFLTHLSHDEIKIKLTSAALFIFVKPHKEICHNFLIFLIYGIIYKEKSIILLKYH
jgi:hypothetical protein